MESEESSIPFNYSKSKQTSTIILQKSQVYFNNLTSGNKGIETEQKIDKIFKHKNSKHTAENNIEEINQFSQYDDYQRYETLRPTTKEPVIESLKNQKIQGSQDYIFTKDLQNVFDVKNIERITERVESEQKVSQNTLFNKNDDPIDCMSELFKNKLEQSAFENYKYLSIVYSEQYRMNLRKLIPYDLYKTLIKKLQNDQMEIQIQFLMTNIKPLLFKIMELSTNKFYDDLKKQFENDYGYNSQKNIFQQYVQKMNQKLQKEIDAGKKGGIITYENQFISGIEIEINEKIQKAVSIFYKEHYDKNLENFRMECKKKTVKYLLKKGIIQKQKD